MNLVVSRRAANRLTEIATYIHTHNPSAAFTVRDKLQTTFTLIAGRPYVGRPLRGKVRRFAVPRLPFVILYRVEEEADEVVILTVRHTVQQEQA